MCGVFFPARSLIQFLVDNYMKTEHIVGQQLQILETLKNEETNSLSSSISNAREDDFSRFERDLVRNRKLKGEIVG